MMPKETRSRYRLSDTKRKLESGSIKNDGLHLQSVWR